jgi:2-dehydro-3-deoxygluconokinase
MRFLSIGECMLELSPAGDRGDLWRTAFAGDTLNAAWYARRLIGAGWQVDYLTVVGTDAVSTRMLAFLEAAGIGTGHIGRHPSRRPGLYMIELQNGERSFSYWRDTSAARCLADDPGRLAAALSGASLAYFSGITIAILTRQARANLYAALADARAAGCRIVFDPNIRPRLWTDAGEMRSATSAAAALSDIVLPSFDDEQAAFGDRTPLATAERYLDLGAHEVVVKNGGERMALGLGSGGKRETLSLPALDRVVPVDTTAAGDSFNGAYLAARLDGAPPDAAIRFGHEVARQVVGYRGALMPVDELVVPALGL